VKADISVSVGKLGTLKAAEVGAKTETVARNLFEKYPNVDKLLALQTMAATYCAMLSGSKLEDAEKLDRWEAFQSKVLNLQESAPPKGSRSTYPQSSSSNPPKGKFKAVAVLPIAVAGEDQNLAVGTLAALDGSASIDPKRRELRYEWHLLSKPAGSQSSLSDSTRAKVTLRIDKAGEYDVTLSVSAGPVAGKTAFVVITSPMIDPLGFRPIDVRFNKATGMLVAVSAEPNRLHIYDPASKTDRTVDLPLPPSSVSVEPDGKFAAVSHSGWISYIALTDPKLVRTYEVSTDAVDIVLPGNGYVYAFPRSGQWTNIHTVNLQSGFEDLSRIQQLYADTRVVLHPDGQFIYGAQNGLIPASIQKFDISKGSVTFIPSMRRSGEDHPACGHLWMSEDGQRLFSKCGNVFRASTAPSEDMKFNGTLQGITRLSAVDHSKRCGKVVAVPEGAATKDADEVVNQYDDKLLAFEESIKLPRFVFGKQLFAAHGRFIFTDAQRQIFMVVVEADETSGALNDYGMVSYPLEGCGTSVARS
jgi:chitinase